MIEISKFKSGIDESHHDADYLMCELLDSFGYTEGTEIFRKMEKWYA